jgi:uncharacterized NAD(P)/FAD-binding protein YdhS
LQAINLLRHEGPRATLIERRAAAGRGVAYSTAHPDHLLNVRAGNMSALPQDPDHFVRWLARRRPDLSGFVPRLVYGDYLAELLHEARAAAPDRLDIVHDEACDVALSDTGAEVSLASGATLLADTVILAPGNLPPLIPRPLDPTKLPDGVFAPEPWSPEVAEGLGPDDTVLIVGSGLTMIDIVLLLEARGFRGRMVALSRRGLAPRPHAMQPFPPPSVFAHRRMRWSCSATSARDPRRSAGVPPSMNCARIPRACGRRRACPNAAAFCAICARGGTCIATASRRRWPGGSTRCAGKAGWRSSPANWKPARRTL